MPMLASLGAKFTPKSSAAPEVEASSRLYQTFSAWGVPALAIPGYSGSRTYSMLRLTSMALGRVRWLAGRMPLSCPSPVDSPGGWSAWAGLADAAEADPPNPARPSDALAARPAASAAISTRFLASNGLKIRRFTF
jgi:hypothetical protein